MHDGNPQGLALICNLEGRILRVLRNDLNLENAVEGRLFVALIESPSRVKALNFLTAIKSQGAAFDWEMNVFANGEILALHFAGGIMDDALLITASFNGRLAQKLYGDMLSINNEQTNLLRAVLKERTAAPLPPAAPLSDSMYDEISRLNNELVAMQRELSRKNAELERLNALKNQFLGMAAHDLRNPLQNILYYSDFLLESGEALSPQQAEFIQSIHNLSQYMATLVNDLLDFAAIEAGKLRLDLQPVQLKTLIQNNVNRHRPLAARRNISLELQAEEVPALLLDAAKMEQTLDNLISNAVKYSPANSRVWIQLQARENEVLISVRDEGPGVPPGEMEKLFKPFQRASVKSASGEKSVGLGLAIVKRIVDGHGGRIWLESQAGVGSSFYVAFPLAKKKDDS